MPRWVFMCGTALAIYGAGKWWTFRNARPIGNAADLRAAAYLLAWPGMDPERFIAPERMVPRPPASEWITAALTTAMGVTLTWRIAEMSLPEHPLVAGWIGMLGLVLAFHFGALRLVSLGWRARGIDATPVMRSPWQSRSLAEFWGRRWNTAFRDLVHRAAFVPLRRAFGPRRASMIVFLVSGLVHELVVTVPAGGAYGLPTAYFLLQGAGVAAERTRRGRALGLGRGVIGWAFTMLVTAAPAFYLFPPPFVRNVILPMLVALGAW